MKVPIKTVSILLGALAALEGIALFAARADAEAIAAGRKPKFSYQAAFYFDGGTTVYQGLGYSVISPRGIAGVRDAYGKVVIGYAQAPQAGINYWLPLWPALKSRPPYAVYLPKSNAEPNSVSRENARE